MWWGVVGARGGRAMRRGASMARKTTTAERSWILYDVGNSAVVLLSTALIPVYFWAIATGSVMAVSYTQLEVYKRAGDKLAADERQEHAATEFFPGAGGEGFQASGEEGGRVGRGEAGQEVDRELVARARDPR